MRHGRSITLATLGAAAAAALAATASSAPAQGNEARARYAAPTARAAGHVARTERSIVRCANRERGKRGLPALATSRTLARAARLHARDMLERGFFDHTGPDGRDPFERVHALEGGSRFTAVGENIAFGYRSARDTCDAWMRSRGHRRNILRRGFTHVGGGYARGSAGYRPHYVQVFGTIEPRAGR